MASKLIEEIAESIFKAIGLGVHTKGENKEFVR